jgi:hypothetical protein
MAVIGFTDNYEDLSSDKGYQFKFFCQCCGNGYLSSFRMNKQGVAGELLRGAGGLLGGILGRAADAVGDVQRAAAGPAHDAALKDAVEEMRPRFVQCKRCGQWVCREICWNDERSLCKNCAPILQRELAAQQAQITVEQTAEKLRSSDLTAGIDMKSKAKAACPKCGAAVSGGKFCPECGAELAPSDACSACGAKLSPGAKFCPECGAKRG